jgi:hypothetical protein
VRDTLAGRGRWQERLLNCRDSWCRGCFTAGWFACGFLVGVKESRCEIVNYGVWGHCTSVLSGLFGEPAGQAECENTTWLSSRRRCEQPSAAAGGGTSPWVRESGCVA